MKYNNDGLGGIWIAYSGIGVSYSGVRARQACGEHHMSGAGQAIQSSAPSVLWYSRQLPLPAG